MKVITLIDNDFDIAVHRLSDMVMADFSPDLAVGVLSGGAVVAKALMERFEQAGLHCSYTQLRLQRQSTPRKQTPIVAWTIRVLPTMLLDWLRMAEATWRELTAPKTMPTDSISLPDDVADAASKSHRILVVDDAIDTGLTAARIVAALKTINPDVDIRIAVIASTMKHPLITANYCLLPHHVLVRFPWSADLKPSHK